MSVNATRVLVVDDEPEIVRGLSIVLRDAGYAVEAASTKGGALAAERRFASEHVVDIISHASEGELIVPAT